MLNLIQRHVDLRFKRIGIEISIFFQQINLHKICQTHHGKLNFISQFNQSLFFFKFVHYLIDCTLLSRLLNKLIYKRRDSLCVTFKDRIELRKNKIFI